MKTYYVIHDGENIVKHFEARGNLDIASQFAEKHNLIIQEFQVDGIPKFSIFDGMIMCETVICLGYVQK